MCSYMVTLFTVAVQATLYAIRVCSFGVWMRGNVSSLVLQLMPMIINMFVENLAFRGRTWQQYPWPDKDKDFGSENAVDGFYTNRSALGGHCAISDDGKYTATWRVYMGKEVSISHIDIYYRTDNQQIFNNKTYGQDCSSMCGKCINWETCHHVNGSCLHGCSEGMQGDKCQEECQIGYYGNDCKNKCSVNCKMTSSCDKITGQCDGRCIIGWSGNTCNQRVSENPCNENNHILCPLTIVFSVVLVFAGSALNFFYWKRENTKCIKTCKTDLTPSKNNTGNINEIITRPFSSTWKLMKLTISKQTMGQLVILILTYKYEYIKRRILITTTLMPFIFAQVFT